MSTRPDFDRSISAWLIAEAPERAPELLLEASRERIRSTRQRRSWWPVWRFADMNTYAKLAIAAAAVLVVALVGYNLLPAGGGNVGVAPPVSPTPSPSVSVPPTAASSPSPSDFAFFPAGSIEAGRHSMILSGKSLSVDMASGWTSHLGYRIYTQSGQAAFIFWTPPPTNVYADPCTKEPLDPPAGDTPAELAAAVSSIPGTELVGGPSDLTIGGHPAKLVSIRIRDDIDCEPREFFLWYKQEDGPAGGRWPDALGDAINVWIIDVDGTIVWIEGSASRNTTPALQGEMRQIVESIQFE